MMGRWPVAAACPVCPVLPGMGIGKKAKAARRPQAKKAKGSASPATRPSAPSRRSSRQEKPAANPFGIDQQGDAPELDPADFQLPGRAGQVPEVAGCRVGRSGHVSR